MRYSGNKSLLVYIMKIPMIFMIFSNVTVQKCTTFTLHRQAFTSSLPAIMVHDIEIFVKTNIIIISIIIASQVIKYWHWSIWGDFSLLMSCKGRLHRKCSQHSYCKTTKNHRIIIISDDSSQSLYDHEHIQNCFRLMIFRFPKCHAII